MDVYLAHGLQRDGLQAELFTPDLQDTNMLGGLLALLELSGYAAAWLAQPELPFLATYRLDEALVLVPPHYKVDGKVFCDEALLYVAPVGTPDSILMQDEEAEEAFLAQVSVHCDAILAEHLVQLV